MAGVFAGMLKVIEWKKKKKKLIEWLTDLGVITQKY